MYIRNLLGSEGLCFTLEFYFHDWLAALVDTLEGEVLQVSLNLSIVELPADKTLGIEDGVVWVHGDLVLGGISDETLRVCEGNERGCCAVTLVVGNDLDTVILPDTDARVGGAQVNADSF